MKSHLCIMVKLVRSGKLILGSLLLVAFLFCCTQGQNKKHTSSETEKKSADETLTLDGNTIATRFAVPEGFTRIDARQNSFADYLQRLSLKAKGSKVQYYNGDFKRNQVQAAVLDVSVGDKDLQQCADAIMRLRADYFYNLNQFDSISFNLTNGFAVPFAKWIKGYRVTVSGNNCSWNLSASSDHGTQSYQKYLDFIFSYAGTLSLSKSLHKKNIDEIEIGDVFARGGSPGHAVIVADMALNEKGQRIFLLAQSYMPAQDIHILINEQDPGNSPWYSVPSTNSLQTPEWVFSTEELKTW